MEFQELISPDRILLLEKHYKNKEELLLEILDHSLKDAALESEHREIIQNALLEREKTMSTGIGLGVAIPHCSTEYVRSAVAGFAILRNGVDFQGVDEQPVHLVVLLILPRNKFDRHVKTLATVARLCNDAVFRDAVRKAKNSEEAYEIIVHRSKESLLDAGST